MKERDMNKTKLVEHEAENEQVITWEEACAALKAVFKKKWEKKE
jgi:hypothetical protein